MSLRLGLCAAVVAITAIGSTVVLGSSVAAAPTAPIGDWAGAAVAGNVRLAGEVPSSVANPGAPGSATAASYVRAHDPSGSLSLNFSLPLRNVAQLDALIATEAKTHKYPSRADLYAAFAPTQAQVDALTSWLSAEGFTITKVSPDRSAVAASAPTATVENALSLTINDYTHPGYTANGMKVAPYGFYANAQNPQVPANLGIKGISGLSSVARFFTSAQLAAGTDAPVTASGTRSTAGPQGTAVRTGGYFPQDTRALYDVSGHGITAAGQTLGFVLWGAGETQNAMSAYATHTGDTPITVDLPCVATGNSPYTPSNCTTAQVSGDHLLSILENGNTNGSTGGSWEWGANVETALDIEQAHGMATGAGMKYYLADCTQNPIAGSGLSNGTCNGSDVGMEEAIEDAANDPTLHTVSNSWGYGGETEFGDDDPFKLASESSFAMAAAAGTTMWASTGDSGTYLSGYPADSQYVVGVGGTTDYSTATLTSALTGTAVRSTATTWAAGGSWCSNLESRPSWQVGADVAANAPCPGRAVPDISAIADTNSSVYVTYSRSATATSSGGVGGTSVAAPEMNGMEAMTEAYLATQTFPGGSVPAIGFVGPMLYQLGNSEYGSSYYNDIVCGNTASPSAGPDGDAAGTGWDAATGWGEIDWYNFSVGYAIALGATGLSQPASLKAHYAYGCANTPTNAAERAVSLPTSQVGYSVGSANGTPWIATYLSAGSWGATNNFLKTTDGGATWQATNADMLDVACVSASTCIEVGDGGRIRRTADSGTTWDFVTSPFDKTLTQVACPTSTVCYAAGDRGTVLKSTDAGVTWAYTATADGNPIYGLSCPSATICYAVDNYAHVEKTVNGGTSWTLRSTPVTTPGINVPGSGGPNPFAGLFGITCTTINACVAVGGFPPTGTDAPIVTTTDGGNTWTLRTSNAGASRWLYGVACVGSTCYAVGRSGAIVTSADGGLTWTAMTSNTTSQLTGITCTSATACVATGQGGLVDVLSADTWTVTTGQASGNFLAAVICSSAASCLAVGKQGITLAFDPTGVAASATVQAGGGTTQQMNGLSCVSAGACVAVGNAGTILQTTDGGQTWVSRASGVTAALAGVSCAGTSCTAVGALVSGASTVLHSADGGATWAPQTSGGIVALASVSCTSDTACVAVGAAGVVLRTTDGSTWQAASSGTTASLTSVACPTTSACYAVGALPSGATQAVAIGSSDAGATWTARLSHSPQGLTAVGCANSASCFAVGALGTIVTTTDGGMTWAQQGNPLSGPTTALNAGPAGLTAIFAASCSVVMCAFGTASAGDIMTTPLITVTVTTGGSYGATPSITGLTRSSPEVTVSPAGLASAVTGTLGCVTAATSASDVGSYPLTSCTGFSADGYSIVYDLDDSGYTVGQADQTITFSAIAEATFGDADFAPNASASSALPIAFSLDGACQIVSGLVHITGAGRCTVTASQAGSADWKAATPVEQSFDIAKADQTITFASLDPKTFGDANFQIDPSASSGLPVTVSATGPCSVDSATAPADVSITGGGTCTITASQGGDDNYVTAPNVALSFDIAKENQVITFGQLTDKTYGDADFSLSAAASSRLPVLYSTAGQCSVTGQTVSITGAGDCTITASQAGDDSYNPAAAVDQTFHIATSGQTITVARPADTTFGAPDATLTATASSGLPVLVAVTGSCSISGLKVHATGVGTCIVVAIQNGDSNYKAASSVIQSFSIGKGTPMITFASPGNKVFGVRAFTVAATVNSDQTPVYASPTPTVCAVSGSTVSVKGVGTCTVTATVTPDDNWTGGTRSVSFSVAKGTPTITFATPANRVLSAAAVTVTATASSGQAVTFSSGTSTVCTVTGSTVRLRAAGTCTVISKTVASNNWNAATKSVSFSVTRATPTVKVTSPTGRTAGPITLTASVTGVAGVTPTGSAKITVGSKSCTISALNTAGTGSCALTATVGTYKVTAAYHGNANYLAASGTTTVTVAKHVATATVKVTTAALSGGRHTITTTATLTPATGVALTGRVTVNDGKGQTCAANVAGNKATCTVTVKTTGTFTLTVGYSGDAQNAAVTKKTSVRF